MLGLIARPFDLTLDATDSSASSATFPSSNLANNDYGRVARSTTGAIGTYTYVFDLGSAKSVDTAALLWHNLRAADTVRIRAGATGAGALAGTLYDSTALAATTGTSLRDVSAPGKFLLTLSNAVAAQFWAVSMSIVGTVHADGFAQASRLFLGKSAVFAIGPQKAEVTSFDMNQKIQLETGEDRSSEDTLLIRPIVQLDLNYAKESEIRNVIGQYTLGLGNSRPMMAIPDITNATGLQDQIAFGRLENVISNQSDTYDIWKFQARVRSFGP